MSEQAGSLLHLDVPRRVEKQIMAVRILEAASRSDVPMTTEALAKATSLRKAQVIETITDREFRSIATMTVERKTLMLMGRALDTLGEVIDGGSDKDKINAIGKLTTLYSTLARARDGHGEIGAEEQVLKLLDDVAPPPVSKIQHEEP